METYAGLDWAGDDPRTAMLQTLKRVSNAFAAEVQVLPETQRAAMLKLGGAVIVPRLVDALGVLYSPGLLQQLDLDQPLTAVATDAAALLKDGSETNEGFRAALLICLSVRELLEVLQSPPHDPVALVRVGMEVGRADVRLTQVSSGLWVVMANSTANADAATNMSKSRKKGGATQAQNNKNDARAWKERALPYAIEMDAAHPDVSRDELADMITTHFKKKVKGHRAVYAWLQNEAEEPNGPIRSRAKKRT